MFWTRARKQAGQSIAIAAILLALAGCGTATTTASGTVASATPTATATATSVATATATAANTTGLPAGCSDMAGLPITHVGALAITQVTMALNYPDWTIPQGTPLHPLQIPPSETGSPAQGSVTVGSHGTTDGYFAFMVCNLSTSQSLTLQSVSVRVASFTSYSGPLSAWSPCNDGTYDAQTQSASSGGCGGGLGSNEYLRATFPGDAGVGASVIAQVASTSAARPGDPDPFPKLPFTLAPGHSVGMAATLTVPTTPGTYAFAFGIAVGSAAPTYFSTASPTLYAPITQDWSGKNCTTASMKAQIPASTQHTQYICPPAA